MRTITLSSGEKVMVDDADYAHLSTFKWHMHKSGGRGHRNLFYAARSQREGKRVTTIRMHRQITDCPRGMEVDHVDKNGLNNQRYNLEIVTQEENIKRRWNKSESVGVGCDVPF